jgi:hypothetical protein
MSFSFTASKEDFSHLNMSEKYAYLIYLGEMEFDSGLESVMFGIL